MSKGFLFAVAAITALTHFAMAGSAMAAPPRNAAARAPVGVLQDDSARVIRVSTTGKGSPVHQRITLGLAKSVIVELDRETRDVLVANPAIVDAVVRSPKRIFLLAVKTGQTNAFFFDADGRQLLSLDIRVEKDVTDLADMMAANLPNSSIKVMAMNDSVVLSGSVASAQESTHAADLAASFTGDPKKVVNMLGIAGGEQVMLKVRIAEMSRSIAKQFGVDLATAANINGTPIFASTANPFGLLGHALSDASISQAGSICPSSYFPTTAVTNTTITSTNPALQLPGAISNTSVTNPCAGRGNAQGVMKALEQVGLLHMLAEPNLTAVSGETAKFLAGGEFPIPTAKDRDGNITLTFKPFGVGLSFTPVVLSPGRISLQISTEVSQLTNTGAYTLQGATTTANGVVTTTPGLSIPALSVRRAETTVELPSGGSFAIAGLMQNVSKQVIDGFPGVKDLPVLGALFRSRDFQNDESELVVLISAYLVQPNTESAFTAPTEGFQIPTDPETLLLGRLNAVYKNKDKPVAPKAAAPVGFVVR